MHESNAQFTLAHWILPGHVIMARSLWVKVVSVKHVDLHGRTFVSILAAPIPDLYTRKRFNDCMDCDVDRERLYTITREGVTIITTTGCKFLYDALIPAVDAYVPQDAPASPFIRWELFNGCLRGIERNSGTCVAEIDLAHLCHSELGTYQLTSYFPLRDLHKPTGEASTTFHRTVDDAITAAEREYVLTRRVVIVNMKTMRTIATFTHPDHEEALHMAYATAKVLNHPDYEVLDQYRMSPSKVEVEA